MQSFIKNCVTNKKGIWGIYCLSWAYGHHELNWGFVSQEEDKNGY